MLPIGDYVHWQGLARRDEYIRSTSYVSWQWLA
jgi:hypothetical protein